MATLSGVSLSGVYRDFGKDKMVLKVCAADFARNVRNERVSVVFPRDSALLKSSRVAWLTRIIANYVAVNLLKH